MTGGVSQSVSQSARHRPRRTIGVKFSSIFLKSEHTRTARHAVALPDQCAIIGIFVVRPSFSDYLLAPFEIQLSRLPLRVCQCATPDYTGSARNFRRYCLERIGTGKRNLRIFAFWEFRKIYRFCSFIYLALRVKFRGNIDFQLRF